MKNKILKFVELIREGFEIDDEYIKDITTSLKDEFIEFKIKKGYFSEESMKYHNGSEILSELPIYSTDKHCYRIEISFGELNRLQTSRNPNGFALVKNDKRFFTIIEEIHQLVERLDNEFYISINQSMWPIRLFLYITYDDMLNRLF